MNNLLSPQQLRIIHQAMNEVLNGLYIDKFEERIGEPNFVKIELDKIKRLFKSCSYDEAKFPDFKASPEELKVYRNSLLIACEEIEDWEFQTRMGVEKDEVKELLNWMSSDLI